MPNLTQKEVDKWLEAAWRDGFSKGVDGTDEIPDFKTLDPRGEKGGKMKSDPSEDSKLPFNVCKCSARTYKAGFGVQCTRSKFGEGQFCKTHQKQSDNLPEGMTILKFGRYDEERPTHWYNDPESTKISWVDTRKSGVRGKPKEKKLKVAEIKEYLSTRIPNESLKGLKKPELEELYFKEKSTEGAGDDSNSEADTEPISENDGSPPPSEPDEEMEPEPEPEPDHEMEPEPEPEPDLPPLSHDDPVMQSNQVVVSSLSVPEYKKLFKDFGISTEGLKGQRAYKAKYEEYLSQKKANEESGEGDGQVSDEELDEDVDYVPIDFEGVEYLEDEESGKIYDTGHNLIGKWNQSVDDIIWENETAKINHETKKD